MPKGRDLRVKFSRCGGARYISHLDLMKTFTRALRRAGLPMGYSQGFNPHMHIVFALPLSVGVTSEAEYADLTVCEDVPVDAFIERFNASLPESIRVLSGAYRLTRANIMSAVSRASYIVRVTMNDAADAQSMSAAMTDFLAQPQIFAEKTGKAGTRQIDIRPMIHDVHGKVGAEGTDVDECVLTLTMTVSAGSESNLKPELMVNALAAFAGMTQDGHQIVDIDVHRTGLYLGKSGNIDPLDAQGL